MSTIASESSCALIVDDESGNLGEIALRLLRLGIDTYYSKDVSEAWLLAQQEAPRIRALLFPPTLELERVTEIVNGLRSRVSDAAVALVAIGPRPAEGACEALRKDGVEHVLWEPFDDSALRALVREAMWPHQVGRRAPRHPTTLMARAYAGMRRRDAVASQLSTRGVFLETPRPYPLDAQITLEIVLPDGILYAKARVAHSHYQPGPNEPPGPVGMGVEFLELNSEAEERLRSYLTDVAEQYDL